MHRSIRLLLLLLRLWMIFLILGERLLFSFGHNEQKEHEESADAGCGQDPAPQTGDDQNDRIF